MLVSLLASCSSFFALKTIYLLKRLMNTHRLLLTLLSRLLVFRHLAISKIAAWLHIVIGYTIKGRETFLDDIFAGVRVSVSEVCYWLSRKILDRQDWTLPDSKTCVVGHRFKNRSGLLGKIERSCDVETTCRYILGSEVKVTWSTRHRHSEKVEEIWRHRLSLLSCFATQPALVTSSICSLKASMVFGIYFDTIEVICSGVLLHSGESAYALVMAR